MSRLRTLFVVHGRVVKHRLLLSQQNQSDVLPWHQAPPNVLLGQPKRVASQESKCSVLEVHGCEFRLIGSWWAEAARQEAGAPGSGGHGPARAERALPVRQRTQSEALLWGAAGAVRGGAGQGVLVPAGPLGRVGAGCAIRRRGGRAAG